MRSIPLTKDENNIVLDQVGAEVMNAVSGQPFDEAKTELLRNAVFGMVHNNQKMMHDNRVVVLGHLRRVNYGE